MQEVLLHAYLAYRLNRTFVYYNYTWRDNGSQYTLYNGKPIPSQIPLSVLLQGPVLGAPSMTDPSAPHPFAVSEVYYRSVCPEDQRVYVRMEQVLSTMGRSASAGDVVDKWIEVYADFPDRCVQVPRDAYHNIDYYIFGSADRLLDVWPVFAKSPVIREFAWSPLVELAFDQNRETFAPTDRYVTPLGIQHTTLSVYNEHSLRYASIPGLLVVHVRRGDFDEHCKKLASWASPILGFNSFPSMPDTFLFPAGTTEGERVALQRPHCYPSIAEIVQRVGDVRAGEEGLTDVYFMTNGPEDWVDELKAAVQKTGGWRSVGSSRDLVLNWEQTFVKQAVDMLIGQRAQVFVGNGWSSLSGLVNMLRVANGVAVAKNRLL
ncbi:hypothetical protein DAEQUDRAFT_730613 [Daedalea quercina L-15889]|uniref:Uncharacterized protein n=1 Tax=Daedalea quercina L-15889 TaxID=1314783 RepID=A0A165MTX2_9APHY|nr:hypothetical protein DAEQUDRAFT_730613 [Daedalea quercina L-15889]